MEDLQVTLSMIGAIAGLTVTTLTFLVRIISISKARKRCEQVIKIGNAVLPFIREAEKFSNYSGTEKKAYVMIKATQFAAKNKISFNEEQVSEKIEELVALTRQVNCKKNPTKEEVEKEMKQVIHSQSWL